MRIVVIAVLMTACCFIATGEVLRTENYQISIHRDCPEGSVSCDWVQIQIRKEGETKATELRGSTWHTSGSDGITPSRFLGYRAKDELENRYFIHEDGALKIQHEDGTVIVAELGHWDYGAEQTL